MAWVAYSEGRCTTMIAEHRLTLTGPGAGAGRPTPEAAGDVLRLIDPLVHEAVSAGFRRPGHTRGRKPDWLRAACDVRYIGISAGPRDATILYFAAPRFGDAAKEVYEQLELFPLRPHANDTGFDLLGDALGDIGNQEKDSERFDQRLLRSVGLFKTLSVKHGLDGVFLDGDRISPDNPRVLNAQIADFAGALYRQTPAPRRARIAGKLDMIRDSDNVFVLLLDDGSQIRGVWAGGEMKELGTYFGQYVLVEGKALFKPSGSVLRVEADAMAPGTQTDRFFSVPPKPTGAQFDLTRLRQPQRAGTGVGAIFGKWPGDETEEELLAALKEMG